MWAAHCHIALLNIVMENTSVAKKQLKEALSKAKPGGAQEVLDAIEVTQFRQAKYASDGRNVET